MDLAVRRLGARRAPRRVLYGRSGSCAARTSRRPPWCRAPRRPGSTSVAKGPSRGSAYALRSEPGSPKSRANASGSTTRSVPSGTRSASRVAVDGRVEPDASWTRTTRSVLAPRADVAAVDRDPSLPHRSVTTCEASLGAAGTARALACRPSARTGLSPRWSWPGAPPPGSTAPTRPRSSTTAAPCSSTGARRAVDAARGRGGRRPGADHPPGDLHPRETRGTADPSRRCSPGATRCPHAPTTVGVLAVDMPHVTADDRPAAARGGRRATTAPCLVDPDGRRQLAGGARRRPAGRGPARSRGRSTALRAAPAAGRARPGRGRRRAGDEAATSTPGRTSRDLRRGQIDPARRRGLATPGAGFARSEPVNLHDWIDELCDVLDIETEVDEGLVLDLAQVAADNVERRGRADHDVPARLRRRQPATPTPRRSSGWPPGPGARRGLGPAGRRARPRRRRRRGPRRQHGGPQRRRLRGLSRPRAVGVPAMQRRRRLREPGGPDALAVADAARPRDRAPARCVLDVAATAVNRADLLQRQGLLPAAARRLRRHRPGVQRHRRGGRRRASTGLGGRRRGVRAARRAAATPTAGGRARRPGDAGARRGRPGDRGGAARGRLHGVVQRVHGRRPPAGRDASSSTAAPAGSARFAIQLATALGARVLTTGGYGRRSSRSARDLGADVTINYRERGLRRGGQGGDRRRTAPT